MKIKLYNSLSKQIEEFNPVNQDEVGLYSCGPTVYNYAHIGNMRAFLFADLLQRILRTVGGYNVKWVMNITDIDDKTIRDSQINSPAWLAEMGEQTNSEIENLKKLTEFYQDAFLDDISSLGINIEHFYALPAATDYIDEMQDLIRKIMKNGYAYIAGNSVYFDVEKWRHNDKYGKLFKIDFDNFKKGARIDSDEYEREHISDFVLWKEKKENEPFWDFEIEGKNLLGRPGWHIECSTMEYELLGLPFDIHTGGVDLKFPHHEDEIAQSKAGYDCEPTNYWLHNDFLEVEGEKMSKSAGNFYTLRDLTQKGIEPLDIRFTMLSAHYRTKLNFTFAGLDSYKKARIRIQEFIWSLLDEKTSGDIIADCEKFRNDVFSQLANDLHTPKALAEIFSFINTTEPDKFSKDTKSKLLNIFREINDIFDVFSFDAKPEEINQIPQDIINLAEERWQAKKSKDYAKSDELRKKILELGWEIKDAKEDYKIIKL